MLSKDEFERALRGARRGDERSFARLWRAHHPALLDYLSTMVGTAADDLAAETWVDVIRGLHRFRGDQAEFHELLLTTAHGRLHDRRRIAHRGRNAGAVPRDEDAAIRAFRAARLVTPLRRS